MNSEIMDCRSEIDTLDTEILSLLGKRFELSRKIAFAKRNLAMPIIDPERELSVLERVSGLGRESPDHLNVLAVFRQILQESVSVQLKVGIREDHLGTSRIESRVR